MNKWLLVWNIVLTGIVLVLGLGACTSDSRIPWLVQQVQSLQIQLATVSAAQQQDAQNIQTQANQMMEIQNYTQTSITQLQQIVQQVLNK